MVHRKEASKVYIKEKINRRFRGGQNNNGTAFVAFHQRPAHGRAGDVYDSDDFSFGSFAENWH